MAYQITGTYFENCNCDVACPCGASNLVLPATNERCTFLMAPSDRKRAIPTGARMDCTESGTKTTI